MLDAPQIQALLRDRAEHPRGPAAPSTDLHEEMERLEAEGEIIIHRLRPENRTVEVRTLYGRVKRIPTDHLWQHKSCGQCGNLPGYPASLLWLMNRTGRRYLNEPHQTSCTAWNYHGTATSNPTSLAAVAVRNFHRAYETGFFPLIHCGTSFGNYKEMRRLLVEDAELRHRVRAILRKLGRDLVLPEEIVHYSEWLHVMAPELLAQRRFDVSGITAAVHEPCHYYKIVPEDAIYDPRVLGGQRPAAPTGILLALGARVADYSTWYDCCGFGFRHVLAEREFCRTFSIERKVRPMVEEAKADVAISSDTGCVTTLDKSQWIARARGREFHLPILSDAQFTALALGAHPYKVVQVHWHAQPVEGLLEKMGIDAKGAKSEFAEYLKALGAGAAPEMLYPPHAEIERYFATNRGGALPEEEPPASAEGRPPSDRDPPEGA